MARYHEKKKHTALARMMTVIFMALFVTVVGVNLTCQMDTYAQLKAEETRIQAQIEEQELRKLQLTSQKEYYNSDAYIEKIAREQLGLIKSNERLFINRSK